MSTRENIEKEIEMRLTNYKRAIARLREKGSETSDEARATIERKLQELKEIEATAEARLKDLKESSDDSWDSVKKEVEKYWDSLGRELKAYDDPTH